MSIFFEDPDLEGLTPAPRAPQSFGDDVLAARQAQLNIENFNAERYARDRVWPEYIDELERLTGERFELPRQIQVDHPAGMLERDAPGLRHDMQVEQALARIDEYRAAHPELSLPGAEWMDDRLATRLQEIEARAQGAEILPQFVGSMLGAFEDPLTIATLPFGGPAVGGGRTAVGTAARVFLAEAAINGLVVAATEPVANEWRAELGLPERTLGQSAFNIAVGAVAGGTLGSAPVAIPAGFDALSRLPARRLADMAEDLNPGDPDVAAAAAAIRREDDIAQDNPFEAGPFSPAEAAGVHRDRLDDALTVMREGPTPAGRAAAERLDQAPPLAVRPNRERLPAGLTEVDPRELEVNAELFQFKAGGDAEGVTDRLANVGRWDQVKAGISIVWEAQDGQRFIVDGHQRRGLAVRLLENDPEAPIRLTAIVRREADGWTVEAVRAEAAMKNLAEGTGTAIDAAKVLRADPDLLDASVPQRGALIRDARDMMTLSDEAFGAVINEVIPSRYGAIVGRLIDDAAEQMAVIDTLARLEPSSVFEAESIVRQAREAGFRKAEGDTLSLFGDEGVESLVGDRAKILSNAARLLRQEKQVFSTLSREADRIESAGNRLARETNQQRAQSNATVLEIIQRLANSKGPVSDALTAAARSGEPVRTAARGFLRALRDLEASGDLLGAATGGAGRASDAATPRRSSAEPPRVAAAEPGAPVRLDELPPAAQVRAHEDFIASQAARRTVEDLLDGADALARELEASLTTAAPRGARVEMGPVKTAERIQEKIELKNYADASRNTDVVRGAILVRNVDDLEHAAGNLAEQHAVLDEGVIVHEGGYIDRKILVRLSDGRIGEVQLTSPELWAAKMGEGQALYTRARTLPADEPERAALMQQSRDLYEAALADADQSWAALAGMAGRPGNISSNSALETSRPPSSQAPGLRGSQDLSLDPNTQPRPEPSTTAGVRSQSMNFIGDTSEENIGRSGSRGKPEEEFDADLFLGPEERSGGRMITRQEIEDGIAADEAAVNRLRECV